VTTRTKGRRCGDKFRHETKLGAARHVRRLVGRGSAPGSMVVYRCSLCGFWHVGHREHRRR
jgi:hypothetical protein